MKLYILGAHQRKRVLLPVKAEHRFDRALVLRIDTDTGSSEVVIEYETPLAAKADSYSSNIFASGTLNSGTLFVCTYTEILGFEVPGFKQTSYISLPCFNALHHVRPTKRGTLLIVNTGLDMVVETRMDGTIVREWSVLGESLWSRFSQNVDYRKVTSTKPHRSHPNFAFELQDDVWVTRFRQRDAICLTRLAPHIDIGIERPHDGVLHEGLLYFTTVDGHMITVDAQSLQIRSVLNLKTFKGEVLPGPAWCRGVLVQSRELVWVGFTRIRKTWSMENINWIKHGFRKIDPPTHLSLFNLSRGVCLQTIDLEVHGINIVFSIHSADHLV